MTTNFLLDTSILIDIIRTKAISKLELSNLKEAIFSVATVTEIELYSGKSYWANPAAQAQTDAILTVVTKLNIDGKIVRLAGKIKSESGVGIIDCIIAATAIEHDLTLVTLNTKDFAKINGLKFQKGF